MRSDKPKPAKKVSSIRSKLPTPEDKQHIKDIDLLARLVKELLSTNGEVISSSRSKTSNPLVKQAERYINVLHSSNCKVEAHHELFRELYNENRTQFLKSVGHEQWMKNCSVSAHLGKGTEFEKNKIILRISIACTNALQLREDIEKKQYKNENLRERAFGSTDYQYMPLLYFRLLVVIRNALGEKNADYGRLSSLIDHYKEDADIFSEEDEDTEKPKGEGIKRLINDVSGGKSKLDSGNIMEVIEKVTSNTEMVDKITDAMKNVGSDKANRGKAFAKVTEEVAPVFMDLFDSVAGGAIQKEDESGETESGSSSDDD